MDDGAKFSPRAGAGTAADFLAVREKISLALMFPEDAEREVCDASEQWETALNFLESASTFASTLAFSRSLDTDKTIVFKGVIASDSDEMPVFSLVCGTNIQKYLILKGIIEVERVKGIETARTSPPFS